jgi:hypothetical protein
MANVWHNPKSTTHKTLVVDGECVYVGSADDVGQLEVLVSSGETPLPLLGEKAVSLTDVELKSIESDEGRKLVTMHYVRDGQRRMTMFDVASSDERREVLSSLENALSLTSTMTRTSKLSAAKGPFVAVVAAGFFTSILADAAEEIAAGDEVSTTGRRAGLKKLLVLVLELIGTTGVYVLGGVAVVAAVVWLCKSVANPPVTTILKPGLS